MCHIGEPEAAPWNGRLVLSEHAAPVRFLSKSPYLRAPKKYLAIHHQLFSLSQFYLLHKSKTSTPGECHQRSLMSVPYTARPSNEPVHAIAGRRGRERHAWRYIWSKSIGRCCSLVTNPFIWNSRYRVASTLRAQGRQQSTPPVDSLIVSLVLSRLS